MLGMDIIFELTGRKGYMQVVDSSQALIARAIAVHASDIFILPSPAGFELKLRHDRQLIVLELMTQQEGQALINHLKYAAQMDVAEHRRPQVGACEYEIADAKYALRLSSIGNFQDRESLVIRIIYGLSESRYFLPEQFQELCALAPRRGLILTSGPTGSGKTTTMYGLAKHIGQDKLVMSIEDPVEINETNFLQVQVNDRAEMAYEALLKAALRHRPDVLIIGEIRDSGTARLAVDAALSGHLVLATVHAKSTFQTIARLAGLGISQTDLRNCLTAISYQRLLPSAQGIACLLDIAGPARLIPALQHPQSQAFVAWQTKLHDLFQEGMIDETTYETFQNG